MSTALLQVKGLSKTFPGLRALDDVSLEVGPGEILAVVGQNGSGKSTLVKILAGVHAPDPGAEITVRAAGGELVTGGAAHDELHFIHQDLGLIPMLSTIENLDLGREHRRGGLLPISGGDEVRRAEELIARFGASFDVRVPVAALSAAERTIVAIARALDGWTRPDKVLVLDEPTAALHGDEVQRLFAAVRRVAELGAGVMFISHRLDEVMDLADRVLALRDGQVVADVRAGAYDHEALVRMIAGRQLAEARIERRRAPGTRVLDVRGLSGATVRSFDASVRSGEIVGVTGILGSGREHVAGLLFGAVARTGGEVRLGDEPFGAAHPAEAIARGVAYVPADRKGDGAIMGLSVRENLTLPRLAPLRRAMFRIDRRREREECDRWIADIDLRPASPEQALGTFSGGNQQKVVLARWLRNDPELLLLDEPTQGVDVGAKAAVYTLVAGAAEQGTAVLVSSSDTKELLLLCDRVLVMREGFVVAEFAKEALDEQRLVRASLGLQDDGAEALGAREQEDVHV